MLQTFAPDCSEEAIKKYSEEVARQGALLHGMAKVSKLSMSQEGVQLAANAVSAVHADSIRCFPLFTGHTLI